MNIHILTDEKANTGGIWTSIELIKEMLEQLGHNVNIGHEINEVDLVWVHEFSNPSLLSTTIKSLQQKNVPIWIHVHDYRHICITGRKSFSKPFNNCHQRLSLKCFYKHITRNCGKGRNPLTLVKKFMSAKRMHSILKEADLVTVYSNYIKQELITNNFNPDRVLKIGPFFKSYENKLIQRTTTPEISLLWVGRFVKEKGIIDFVSILDSLNTLNFKFNATIIGQGNLDSTIKSLIEKKNLTSKINLKSWVSPNELEIFYKNHDILIFNPQWPEPLGMVGLEAISAGTHVITNGSGGSIEWAENHPKEVKIARTNKEIVEKIISYKREGGTNSPEGYDKQLEILDNLIKSKTMNNKVVK